MANDIFDLSNVKFFKEIEKKKWRMFILCYEGGSIYNETPFITPSTNAIGFYAICQTKDQSVAVIMVHETLLYLSKFTKLQTF